MYLDVLVHIANSGYVAVVFVATMLAIWIVIPLGTAQKPTESIGLPSPGHIGPCPTFNTRRLK
jgi:hypothetical protein